MPSLAILLVALSVAAPATTDAYNCPGREADLEIKISDAGTLDDLRVCHKGIWRDYVGDLPFLTVQIDHAESQPQGVTFHQSRLSSSRQTVYEGRTGDGIELRRTYRWMDDHQLAHSLSVTNVGQLPIRNVDLAMGLGGSPSPPDGVQSLSDHVYRFSRTMVIDDGDSALRPNDDPLPDRVAHLTRHKVMGIASEEAFELRRADVDGLSVPSLVYELGTLDPGSSRTIEQVVTALPSDVATLERAGYLDAAYGAAWPPIRLLSIWVERSLGALSSVMPNMAVAIIAFALIVRLITLPIGVWSARAQQRFREAQAKMAPKIEAARSTLRGAAQSESILQIYREHGVSPFTGLKGSVGLLVHVPILIAMFNVTAQSSLISGEAFMWIDDLANPDALTALPSPIPILGATLNVLPLLLGGLNILSAATLDTTTRTSRYASTGIALAIVIFFYSFAAALVLYWITINVSQILERYWVERQPIRGAHTTA